jgi:hypothetical protein
LAHFHDRHHPSLKVIVDMLNDHFTGFSAD